MNIDKNNYLKFKESGYVLHDGDHIYFPIETYAILDYVCTPSYLAGKNCSNSAIFYHFSLDPYDFCSKIYGYKAGSGNWPDSHIEDFVGLTKVAYALFDICLDTLKPVKSIELGSIKSRLFDSIEKDESAIDPFNSKKIESIEQYLESITSTYEPTPKSTRRSRRNTGILGQLEELPDFDALLEADHRERQNRLDPFF